ncbi:aminopeptidase P family protein [Canibacter sp. lx-45]|uniref:aminopeptidase P family protein n=1 Tax=Canibacter zhuwentaonis TaxID=2837491 RepID=UPI001BDCAA6C|nr:aminopeptidase P family protein [Canibacter zhuwentaonis]MBT1034974.1 aminopeptidase P family protein [Canibacter zhuwentaonis]
MSDKNTNRNVSVCASHEVKIDNFSRTTLSVDSKFLEYMSNNWDAVPSEPATVHEVAPYAAARRAKVSRKFAAKRLVIAAGIMKQRANDTFYMFRPHTSFTHLTGWGANAAPGAVLVFDPVASCAISEDTATTADDVAGAAAQCDSMQHTVTLYFAESATRYSKEFFDNSEVGEFWIGAKPSLKQVSTALGLNCKPITEFQSTADDVTLDNAALAEFLDELRLVKDDYEIAQMQLAVNATGRGFDEVINNLDSAVTAERGERVVEVMFHKHARTAGNWEGYDTIAAAGAHACTLHWITNDGPVKEGELLLLDAGVEVESLYTADITRTVPISGRFNEIQKKVYETVLEAADAAHKVARPGIKFHEVHDAAMAVIAEKVKQWGFLPDNPDPELPYHRRYMVHGTCHHLGIDVHDCAQARREMYYNAILEPGMVFTIEPGLYFHPGDLTVPEEFWGIGVRIEDDIVVTEDGSRNLSAHIPRTVAEVEAWVQSGRK